MADAQLAVPAAATGGVAEAQVVATAQPAQAVQQATTVATYQQQPGGVTNGYYQQSQQVLSYGQQGYMQPGMNGYGGYMGQQGGYMGQPGMPGQPGQPGMPPMLPVFSVSTVMKFLMEAVGIGQGLVMMYGVSQEMGVTSAFSWATSAVGRTIAGLIRRLNPLASTPAVAGPTGQATPLPAQRIRWWVVALNLYFGLSALWEWRAYQQIKRTPVQSAAPKRKAMPAIANGEMPGQAEVPVPRALAGAVLATSASPGAAAPVAAVAGAAVANASQRQATIPAGVPAIAPRTTSAPAIPVAAAGGSASFSPPVTQQPSATTTAAAAKPWQQSPGATQVSTLPPRTKPGGATLPAPSSAPPSTVPPPVAAPGDPSQPGGDVASPGNTAPPNNSMFEFYMQKQRELHKVRQAQREAGEVASGPAPQEGTP
mmetsp:Transcript_31428/g.73400  ORF Transcript_31428/g.73400 Transcript_31428/m.73400 type:complete len:426 (+) Transcript_31428:151-1428(+)